MMRQNTFARTFLVLISLYSAISLPACSSGGNDESSQTDGTACEIIGTKIASGTECKDSDSSDSSLVKLSFVSDTEIGTCTGTVIDDYAVLTAAHCFADNFDYILVETENTVQQATNFAIANVTTSGNDVLYNDAAIVFVDNNLGVPAAPVLSSRSPVTGEPVVIAGFGEIALNGPLGDLYAGKAYISDATANHIFITYEPGQSHPCHGDSGGPLFVNVNGTWALAGVTSQSDPSVNADNVCSNGDVTLYTNLEKSEVAAFIQTNVPGANYK